MRDYGRFDAFLSSLSADVYAEPVYEPHRSITREVIARLHGEGLIRAGMRALDVGCGQGVALAEFRRLGIDAVGVALGADVEVCRGNGFDVRDMDQNFMSFSDNAFDLLWCRHVLEHSVVPLFTLSEYHRVVRPSGLVYVEVPAPDTACHHECNPNHYSVLPRSAWRSLFVRAGFAIERSQSIDVQVPAGPDSYWSFCLRRSA